MEQNIFNNMRVALVECDGCGFAVAFEHPNRTFFFCKKHAFGVNVPTERLNTLQMCRPCNEAMERYDLYVEDNVCPICHSSLSVVYVPKT